MNENYIDIMKSVDVKQMILQGPPGTSKTWRAQYEIVFPIALEKIKKFLLKLENDDYDKEMKELSLTEEEKDNIRKHSIEQLMGSLQNDTKKKIIEATRIKQYKKKYEKTDEETGAGFWDIVQFHPSYGYEDFVRGITVGTSNSTSDGIVYQTVNKVFGNICEYAKHYKKSEVILIIDEINRADIATVFGELIYAMENRGKSITLPYAISNDDYSLSVPEKLYIVGTMNTADKSVGNVDYAIRRRFLFFDCLPDENILRSYYGKDDHFAISAFNIIKDFVGSCMDSKYRQKDLQIGHTYYLLKKANTEQMQKDELKNKLIYQVFPILREYIEDGILSEKLLKEYDEKHNNDILKIILDEYIEDTDSILEKLLSESI